MMVSDQIICAVCYRFSETSVRPGSPVQISVNSAPDSLCAYSVVDKSVDLAPNPNKVTVTRAQSLKEALAKKRVVADKSRGGSGCKNANLLFQSFERAGLFVMSDQLLIDTKCDNLVDVTGDGAKDREEEEEAPRPVPIIGTPDEGVDDGVVGGRPAIDKEEQERTIRMRKSMMRRKTTTNLKTKKTVP